jgi:hypothetical protein
VNVNGAPVLARLSGRVQAYRNRRFALRLALAVIHLGLLGSAVWLVVSQTEDGPVRVFAVGLLTIMSAAVVIMPGSAAALVFIIACGVSYLMLSALESAIGIEVDRAGAYQVLALAAALFLVHALDALRDVLPSDAAIESGVLTRWIRRTAEALVPGLLLGGVLVVLPTAAAGGAFWLLGAIGLLLAVGLPALALRPRPWRDEPSD